MRNEKLHTAVIMAAGMGTRFGTMTEERPKGFIEAGGKPMVVRSIETLISCGIDHIIIGTGYLREAYEQLAAEIGTDASQRYIGADASQRQIVGDAPKPCKVDCCFSPRYADTNSMYTLWNCRDIIGDSDFLLLESDLVFERRAITALIDCPKPDVMLITPVTKFQDQYYVACDDNGTLTNCSTDKSQLETDPSGSVVKGELVGIHKLSSEFYHKMCADYATKVADLPKLGYEYELLYMAQHISPVNVLCEDGLKWYEIDDIDDLNFAEEHIVPFL